jgi:hypothetical protein
VAVTNLTATQAGNVTLFPGSSTGVARNVTTGVKGAANVGQVDTVSITASSDNAAVQAMNILADNVERLEVASETGSAATTVTGLTHQDWTALSLSGPSDMSITSAAGSVNVNTVVNGSTAGGDLRLDFSLSQTNGLNIQGGSGADTITGGQADDVITGNGGQDTLVIADVGTAMIGVDTFTDFAAGGSGDAVAIQDADTTVGNNINEAVLTSSSTDLVTGGGAFDISGGNDTGLTDIFEVTAALDDDAGLDRSSDGNDLLQALSSDETQASGITVDNEGDQFFIAVYQGGDGFLFHGYDADDSAAIAAFEVTLVGVFQDIGNGAFALGDFVMA